MTAVYLIYRFHKECTGMKKVFFLLLFVFLVGCGTAEKEQKATKTENRKEEVKTLTSTEVVEERTIETNGEAPWIRNAAVRLQKLVEDGETVHLWSDAEEFELWIATLIDYVPPKSNAVNAPDPKQEIESVHNSANEHIKIFVGELIKRHPDNKEYFDLLTQAGESLAIGDTETAKNKIEEAKTIRESE
jgi:hypothetical protein